MAPKAARVKRGCMVDIERAESFVECIRVAFDCVDADAELRSEKMEDLTLLIHQIIRVYRLRWSSNSISLTDNGCDAK